MTTGANTIRPTSNPKGVAGTTFRYDSYLTTSTQAIVTDFFDDVPGTQFAVRDLMIARLQDGWFYLRFITPTTAEIDTTS